MEPWALLPRADNHKGGVKVAAVELHVQLRVHPEMIKRNASNVFFHICGTHGSYDDMNRTAGIMSAEDGAAVLIIGKHIMWLTRSPRMKPSTSVRMTSQSCLLISVYEGLECNGGKSSPELLYLVCTSVHMGLCSQPHMYHGKDSSSSPWQKGENIPVYINVGEFWDTIL